ncbi:hypothetical protein MSSIH_3117 [Methanosarcina siciliae HI350]|uniref:Uncharacterized protein n=1 Tax=Methanosarcina siciliae HI350 TaxID=1434119 RepID=A0A0E3PH63_9EURY|nr:hypothetical protein [Methanosarcina siciliae]AKB33807.1 hypothetical protein MSSIH_3117 [Methanosarcina siciliae HI350]
MTEKAKVEPIDPMEKARGGRKKPLVSCEKYDEEERKALLEEEQKDIEEAKVESEEAKVEPIHPSEYRGGKKKGLLDTCK